jgi:putative transposase
LCYVDMNPVRAQLVESASDYPWSSARAHAPGRDPWGLLDHDLWREICPLRDWEGVLRNGWAADSG